MLAVFAWSANRIQNALQTLRDEAWLTDCTQIKKSRPTQKWPHGENQKAISLAKFLRKFWRARNCSVSLLLFNNNTLVVFWC